MKSLRNIFAGMPRLLIVFATLGVALFATAVQSERKDAQDGGEPEAGLLSELKALDQKLEKIKDLKAKITQSKHVALLKDPLTSHGSMLVMGERMRWDIVKPAASTTLTSATEIRIHYPHQKIVEVYTVDQRMASVIASPLPRLAMLLKHFQMERLPLPKDVDEAKFLAVRLKPRNEELKKHLDRVDVLIQIESAVTRRMEMVDVDGDRTVIDFESIELNTNLKPGDFDITLPPGTRIVHPLDAQGKDSK